MGEWQEKVWGRTRAVIESDLYSRHELEVVEGGYCSVHWHVERANRFVVLEGVVRVVELFGWRERTTELTRGNVHEIPSFIPHQFQVLEPGRVVEEYWPDRGGRVSPMDIVRMTQGGRIDVELIREVKGAIR